MSPTMVKIVGTSIAIIVAGVGATYPHYLGLAMTVSGMILTALHIQRPGDAKADK